MSVGQAYNLRERPSRGEHQAVDTLFDEHGADAGRARGDALTFGRAHDEQRGRQPVRCGTLRRNHGDAQQPRLDRTARTRIEDVTVTVSAQFEGPLFLARRADGTVRNPDAEQWPVAIARIRDHNGPASRDAAHEPDAARSEVELRASHTARAKD